MHVNKPAICWSLWVIRTGGILGVRKRRQFVYDGYLRMDKRLFPGTLWFLYEFTNDSCWKEKAVEWTLPLEPNRTNTKDHDVGFMMYNSFGKGFALTKNESYRDILVQTANSLMTRYNPNVHSIQSWEGANRIMTR